MTNLTKKIHTENPFLNAVIDVCLAIIGAGFCVAIPAYGAAAFESEILGLVTYAAIVVASVFVLAVIVHSAIRLAEEFGPSDAPVSARRERDEIAELREKYAHGEITEEELEHELEGVLEENEVETKRTPTATPTTNRSTVRRTFLGKETGIALVVILVLYAITYSTRIAALQLPGYLLIVGFDLIDPFIPPVRSEIAFELLFGCYLYGLAVVIGAMSRGVRHLRNGDVGDVTYPVAITVFLIALLAIGIGIMPAISPPTVHSVQCTGSATESGGAGPVECTTETYTAQPSLNYYALTAGALLALGSIGLVAAGNHVTVDLDIGFKH